MMSALGMHKNAQKEERLAMRLPASAKSTLVRAAEISGRSLTDFVVASALDAAHATLEKHDRMVLSEADQKIFVDALARPSAPNEALVKAARRHEELTK